MSTGCIAFASSIDGQTNFDVYTMDPDGSNATRLTTDPAIDREPTWSPDGSKIVFANLTRDGDSDFEIYVMNSNGSNQHRIIDTPSGTWDYFPAWSPDGSKIAFSEVAQDISQIYTMNENGGGIAPVTHDTASDALPTWSPDSL